MKNEKNSSLGKAKTVICFIAIVLGLVCLISSIFTRTTATIVVGMLCVTFGIIPLSRSRRNEDEKADK